MKVTFEECTVKGETVEMMAKVSVNIREIEERSKVAQFGPECIHVQITAAIAKEVAEQYLKEHKMELVNSVDLKQITDAVQLKVVERFSLNQS